MKTLNVHPAKVWGYLYPIYAREFLFGNNYEDFAAIVAKEFKLTPAQWAELLSEWEFKEQLLSEPETTNK